MDIERTVAGVTAESGDGADDGAKVGPKKGSGKEEAKNRETTDGYMAALLDILSAKPPRRDGQPRRTRRKASSTTAQSLRRLEDNMYGERKVVEPGSAGHSRAAIERRREGGWQEGLEHINHGSYALADGSQVNIPKELMKATIHAMGGTEVMRRRLPCEAAAKKWTQTVAEFACTVPSLMAASVKADQEAQSATRRSAPADSSHEPTTPQASRQQETDTLRKRKEPTTDTAKGDTHTDRKAADSGSDSDSDSNSDNEGATSGPSMQAKPTPQKKGRKAAGKRCGEQRAIDEESSNSSDDERENGAVEGEVIARKGKGPDEMARPFTPRTHHRARHQRAEAATQKEQDWRRQRRRQRQRPRKRRQQGERWRERERARGKGEGRGQGQHRRGQRTILLR
jgi:hypothetical protein